MNTPTKPSSQPNAPLSIVSLNLHGPKLPPSSFATNPDRLRAIADHLLREDVDVVVVQEACISGCFDSMSLLRDHLEEQTRLRWYDAWAQAHVGWKGHPDEAPEGLGLLAIHPIDEARIVFHPTQGSLRRITLLATISSHLGMIRIANVHFDHQHPEVRAAQAREAASDAMIAAQHDANAVIIGDFNAPCASDGCQSIMSWGWQSVYDPHDTHRIDQAFIHPHAPWTVVEASLLFDGGRGPVVSDHPGLLVRLTSIPSSPRPTTLVAHIPWLRSPHRVCVRSGAAYAGGQAGIPAQEVSAGVWKVIVPNAPAGDVFDIEWFCPDHVSHQSHRIAARQTHEVHIVPT